MEGDPDVTICVATCRRPDGLARLLESIGRAAAPAGIRVEIVVVDDDPIGEGARVAAKFDGAPHPVRAFVVGGENVARARNRSVDEARGDWIAFVDDDEEVDSGWLAAHWANRRGDGSFGPVIPRLAGDGPTWIDGETFYARPRHPTGHPLCVSDLRTGNALIRGALIRANRFDPEFGVTGGEDTELFGRLVAGGARFSWCDEATVSEWIPAARRTAGWLLRRAFRGGFLATRIERSRRDAGYLLFATARAVVAGALVAVALVPALLRGRAQLLRIAMRVCVQAGHLWCVVGGDLRSRS